MSDKQTLAQSLRRYGSDFISHPVSRGIEDIETAGELMLEAARVLTEQADDARCRELLEAFDDAPQPKPAEQEARRLAELGWQTINCPVCGESAQVLAAHGIGEQP